MNMQNKRSFLSTQPWVLPAGLFLAGILALGQSGREYLAYLTEADLIQYGRLTGRLSLGLIGLEILLGLIVLGTIWIIWQPKATHRFSQWLLTNRDRFGWLRWLLAGLAVVVPLWVLQHIPISAALGATARLILTIGLGLFVAVIMTRDKHHLVRTDSLLIAWLVIASLFTFGQAFANLSNYPFSLGWSEGNRIWDYSVLFGHRFYNYPADQPIFAYLDLGRQSLWGLPFLFARIPIWAFRLWNGLVSTIPYAILGWLAFQRVDRKTWLWFLCGLWTFLFLNQGPIYTPLVISAWLVAIAWRKPLWIALPLVMIAAFYAQITRFTWMFAPAIWAAMLFFADLDNPKSRNWKWRWSAGLAVFTAGIIGGYLLPQWIDLSSAIAVAEPSQATTTAGSGAAGVDISSLGGLGAFLSRQPLLWERLLPNPTFGPGILLALLIAAAPLILLLVYWRRSRQWQLDLWGQAAIILPALAFLVVGLVASVKIGGGGDLHNMDMFLLTLAFAAALAWRAGSHRTITQIAQQPAWVQGLLVLMMIILAVQSLRDSIPVRIPPAARAQETLSYLQEQVANATTEGEVLFMDQRQLLTFGEVPAIPLVVEYEKKYLMDQALSAEAEYFAGFHSDLAQTRFALIISEPLKVVYRGEEHHFGDENDAWVRWVAEPVLCYYEPIKTFKEVKVQVLVPREVPENCPDFPVE